MSLQVVAGSVLGVAVGGLLRAVLHAKEKASNFKPFLTRLESTLLAIIPRLDEISSLNDKLDVQRQAMEEIVVIVNDGKRLVLKCSKISTINLVKKVRYSHELLDLDNTLLRYFMTILPLDHFKHTKELLIIVKRLEKALASIKDEGICNHFESARNPKNKLGSVVQEDIKLCNDLKIEAAVINVKLAGNKDGRIFDPSESDKPVKNSGSWVQETTDSYQESKKQEDLKLYNHSKERKAVQLYKGTKREGDANLYADFSKEEVTGSCQDSKRQEVMKSYNDSEEKKGVQLYKGIKEGDENLCQYCRKEEAVKLYKDIEKKGDSWLHNADKKQPGKKYREKTGENLLDNLNLADLVWFESDILGKGIYGTTYKCDTKYGTVLINRLNGVKVSEREFKERIEGLRKVGQHPNIMPPLSYYFSDSKKFLIYDYAPAGSLYSRLHENGGGGNPPLDWDSRVKISLGTARAVSHLHIMGGVELIHGNIKSSNILLTHNLDACIADYGLAPMMNFSGIASYEVGYHSPEFVRTRKATMESDVYSFGILLLEILTGIKPALFDLSSWVHSILMETPYDVSEVFDIELFRYNNCFYGMLQMLEIAMKCVEKNPYRRPTMMAVFWMIEHIEPY